MNRLTTAAPASKADRPFGMRDKIGYALGDFGCQMSFALITAYLADFYTQYIGLTEATWAIIIIFLKIWDAVNDPIMGGIMDSRRISAKSKYKPWIRIGSFGLIVSGALAFLPIPHASYAMRVIVCVVTYLAWDIFYTLVNVPYGTLNSAISADPNERTQLSTYRSIGAGAGGLVTLLLPFFGYENNTLSGERFVGIGRLMGAVAFVAYHFCLKMTTERFQVEQPAVTYHYFRTLKRILKNRPLLALCIASFALLVFYTSNVQTTKWVYQIYFQNTQLLTVANLIGSISSVVMIPFVGKIVRRFGKKLAVSVPLLISIVFGSVFLFIPMPRNGMLGPALYMVCLIVLQFGGALFQLVCWAMVADCTDYQQLQTGYREEGSVYAFYSLFRKLAQGVGASLIILSMTWVGYEAKLGANQLPGVGERMKNMAILLMLLGAVIMAVALLLVYNIDKQKEHAMKAALGGEPEGLDIAQALQVNGD